MGSPLGEHLFQFRIAFLLQAMLLSPNSSPPFKKCKCNVEESDAMIYSWRSFITERAEPLATLLRQLVS